jgi:hypothetical protein
MRALLALIVVCATADVSPAQDSANVRTELLNASDFRVRASAALFLGKAKPADARFVLERALDDGHPAVRAAVAAALAAVGDAGVVPSLQKHLAAESSAAVKAQLRSTIAALTPKNVPAAPTIDNARYIVQLGDMRNATNVRGEALGSVMRSATKARASSFKGAVVVEGADDGLYRQANAKHIPVLLLDGTVTRLAQGASNGNVVFQAQVEFSVRKIPQHTLKGTFSGAATTVDSAQALSNLGRIQELQDRAIDGAVESAMRGADRGLARAAK